MQTCSFHLIAFTSKFFAVNNCLKYGTNRHHQMAGFFPVRALPGLYLQKSSLSTFCREVLCLVLPLVCEFHANLDYNQVTFLAITQHFTALVFGVVWIEFVFGE